MSGGGSSGGGGTTTTTQQPSVPPEITALMRFVTPDVQQAYTQGPLSGFTGAQPMAVPGLTPQQQGAVDFSAGAVTQPTLQSPEALALMNLAQLSSGPIGSSPATTEAMKSWEATTGEQIKNQLAMAGIGRSGALATDLGVARSAAHVPLLQQEIANRLGTVGPLAQLGGTMETRPVARQQTAFDMGEMVRQIAQAQAQSQQADYLRRQGIAESITAGVTGQGPQTWGQSGTTLQRFTQPATGIPMSFGFGGKG